MNSQDEINRTADRLRDALGAAADLMPERTATVTAPDRRGPGSAWLVPLAAAAAVVVVVVASALVAGNLGKPSGTAPAGGVASAPPEFYMSLWPPPDHPDTAVLQVHRTSDGALAGSMPFPGLMLQAGFLTADSSDRVFYVAGWPSCTSAVPVSRFYRITITDSGRISGYHAVGAPVRGIVSALALSPDRSRMAYVVQSTERCVNPPLKEPPPSAVHMMDLATGSVRTWQNTVRTASPARVLELVNGLSWTPDGSTLVVNYLWSLGVTPDQGMENLAVVALDATSGGGSIQAHSRLLLHESRGCATCVVDAIAGPGNSLTLSEILPVGNNAWHQRVVREPLGAGQRQTVLFSSPETVSTRGLSGPAIFADPTAGHLIVWPLTDMSSQAYTKVSAGWLSGGTLHRLPGTSLVFGNAIAW